MYYQLGVQGTSLTQHRYWLALITLLFCSQFAIASDVTQPSPPTSCSRFLTDPAAQAPEVIEQELQQFSWFLRAQLGKMTKKIEERVGAECGKGCSLDRLRAIVMSELNSDARRIKNLWIGSIRVLASATVVSVAFASGIKYLQEQLGNIAGPIVFFGGLISHRFIDKLMGASLERLEGILRKRSFQKAGEKFQLGHDRMQRTLLDCFIQSGGRLTLPEGTGRAIHKDAQLLIDNQIGEAKQYLALAMQFDTTAEPDTKLAKLAQKMREAAANSIALAAIRMRDTYAEIIPVDEQLKEDTRVSLEPFNYPTLYQEVIDKIKQIPGSFYHGNFGAFFDDLVGMWLKSKYQSDRHYQRLRERLLPDLRPTPVVTDDGVFDPSDSSQKNKSPRFNAWNYRPHLLP